MLHCIKDTAVRLWNDEVGASLLEYSVLIGLITVAVVTTLIGVSGWMTNKWGSLSNTLNAH
jgi:pilus assembly protein Flp/PilA